MVTRRGLLRGAREAREAVQGRPCTRWTRSQQQLFDSPYKLTVAWGANGVGKSYAIAELTRRAIGGLLYWQKPGPQTVILAGNTWMQLGSTLRYLWQAMDRRWFKAGVRYEAGGMKGQRLHVYDVIGGPGKGGQFILGVFRAENLAGPRANVVITDEPLPSSVFSELWPRLLGRDGRMYQTFTPTLGTSHKLDYLWGLVDDQNKPWAGQIQTVLNMDSVTPRGGLVESAWMTASEIAVFEQGFSSLDVDLRMGRSRQPRMNTAYFSAWRADLIRDVRQVPGTRVGVGIDHGSRPGAQRAQLVGVGGVGLYARVHGMDEHQGNGRTESEQDAKGILDMLDRQGLELGDVDQWIGDRAHHGDHQGGKKSNQRLKQSIAKLIGLDVGRRGWSEGLPTPLRHIQTPRKYDQSIWEGCEILHRLMVGDDPRLSVANRCTVLHEDFSTWQGGRTEASKDGIDAFRYITVPMVEGLRH